MTEVSLYIKGFSTLLYHFLTLTDILADTLMVDYLITMRAYRLLLCTMALQALLTLYHLQETGKSFAELGSC